MNDVAGERRERRERRRGRRRGRLRRGAYLVPSLFTIGNLLLGFYAVVRASRGHFETAALLLFAAGILDGLDGYVARLTGTESDFGREYDSLADVVTFGAAPALIAFLRCADGLGRIAWLVPSFFLVCTATRLARFNVQASSVDSRYFVGLPAPAAAGGVAAVLILAPLLGEAVTPPALLASLVALGVLMVSTFRYLSVKKIDLRRRWSYRAAILAAAFILLLAYQPRTFLVVAAIVYALSGPGLWLAGRFRRQAPTGEDETEPAEAS